MLSENLRMFINDYPDFPSKGIVFKDLSPILKNPYIFSDLIDAMSSLDVYNEAEAIIAIDARGFIFASPIANKLKKPLILARKKNKLPGELIQKSYGLEYGKDILTIQLSSIADYKKFVIVDDLLATGGTAKCVSDLLEERNKSAIALNVVVELSDLKGKNLFDFPVYSQISFN